MRDGIPQFQVLDGLPVDDPQDDPRLDDLIQGNLTELVGLVGHRGIRVKLRHLHMTPKMPAYFNRL